MKVIPVPVRSDNYAYLILSSPQSASDGRQKAAFVDPFDFAKVREVARNDYGIEDEDVIGLLTTHHHADHSGGNEAFAKAFPSLPIWGGSEQIPALNKKVEHGDSFPLFPSINVSCHATPCHTQDSICFFVEDGREGLSQGPEGKDGEKLRAVFTGDTLFVSGCGRFFEGSADEMHKALNVVLASLPGDTVVFCGHEYTKSNVAFSKGVLDADEHVERLVEDLRRQRNGGVTTGVYTIADEKRHNVFMRVADPAVQQKVGGQGEVDTMNKLRELKNQGKLMANI
ncbi:related to GLO4 - glyoxalase II (hydroxyacylglutathione hydrolase) [Pseudozyma flocculosa]|nr:related to GLO4 - glyoxalase II (hydroxyacylglutathione hydrolase) [Pseudozyma flocculosa]